MPPVNLYLLINTLSLLLDPKPSPNIMDGLTQLVEQDAWVVKNSLVPVFNSCGLKNKTLFKSLVPNFFSFKFLFHFQDYLTYALSHSQLHLFLISFPKISLSTYFVHLPWISLFGHHCQFQIQSWITFFAFISHYILNTNRHLAYVGFGLFVI